LNAPSDLKPNHIFRRVGDGRIITFAEQFTFLEPGQLLMGKLPHVFTDDWEKATAEKF
jgi:hypothetical protein